MAALKDLLVHPDIHGSSEYRAIYNCLADSVEGDDKELTADQIDLMMTMLEEFHSWSADVDKTLSQALEAMGGKHEDPQNLT